PPQLDRRRRGAARPRARHRGGGALPALAALAAGARAAGPLLRHGRPPRPGAGRCEAGVRRLRQPPRAGRLRGPGGARARGPGDVPGDAPRRGRPPSHLRARPARRRAGRGDLHHPSPALVPHGVLPVMPELTEPAAFRPGPGTAPSPWPALHVHYAANPQPLLVHCVRPLVDRLTEEGLLSGHFFINYWLEGPHVRLRLRPSGPDAEPEVRRRAEEAIGHFLETRPALYEVHSGFLKVFYNSLFDIEFPGEDRARYMGPDGRMNLRPNNSYRYEVYAPEYAKYGGPAGV